MEKRKLKYSWKRMPEERVSIGDLKKKIIKETGYPKTVVNYVVDEFLESIKFNILDDKLVDIDGIGLIYAGINPPRKVVDFKNEPDELGRTLGKKGMKVKTKQQGATWSLKFRPQGYIKKMLRFKEEPTKEQVENLYKN